MHQNGSKIWSWCDFLSSGLVTCNSSCLRVLAHLSWKLNLSHRQCLLLNPYYASYIINIYIFRLKKKPDDATIFTTESKEISHDVCLCIWILYNIQYTCSFFQVSSRKYNFLLADNFAIRHRPPKSTRDYSEVWLIDWLICVLRRIGDISAI